MPPSLSANLSAAFHSTCFHLLLLLLFLLLFVDVITAVLPRHSEFLVWLACSHHVISVSSSLASLFHHLWQVENAKKTTVKQCDAVDKYFNTLSDHNKTVMCPDLHTPTNRSKPEVIVWTMGRCPYCALTMANLYPVVTGELWDKIDLKDKYILQVCLCLSILALPSLLSFSLSFPSNRNLHKLL